MLPIACKLTGVEESDILLFAESIDAGPNEATRAFVADKGYDGDAKRAMAGERGACHSTRSNRKAIPAPFTKALYRGCARIEQMMGKLKRFNRLP